MRILVTNDDGVESPGIHVLAQAVAQHGHEVIVVAPMTDLTGAGGAIGRVSDDEPIEYKEYGIPDLPAIPAYAVDGPPALCVMVAALNGFGDRPELVVSGINPGVNVGLSVLHSGTVGAVLAARNFGISGMAVSVGWEHPFHWETAAAVASATLPWLIESSARELTSINVNVPNLPLAEVRGVRKATLAKGSRRQAHMEDIGEGRLRMVTRPADNELPKHCDVVLVEQGYATITGLLGIAAGDVPGAAKAAENGLRGSM